MEHHKHHQVSKPQCLSYLSRVDYLIQQTSDRDATATTLQTRDRSQSTTCNSSMLSASEIVAWVLVSILTVLFTGLLSVVLLWMFKKRQARDTSTVFQSMKWRATLVMKPNRSVTHTSMKQSEGKGPRERNKRVHIDLTISKHYFR